MDLDNNRLDDIHAGSVSDPSLNFNGDANTGLYSTGADNFSITAGGEQVLSLGAQALIDVIEDSRTNSIDIAGILRSTTSGTPAAGIGTGLQFDAETTDDSPAPAGLVGFSYTDVDTGSEDSQFVVHLVVGGVAMEEKYLFRSTAATGYTGIFTHAASADRTWTMPDSTGTMLTSEAHNVATNVHGLPASVNVYGNRTASGEFIQRLQTTDLTMGSTDRGVYENNNTETFAVAFSTTPVMTTGGATSSNADQWSGARNISTSAFLLSTFTITSGATMTNCGWVASGT